MTFGAFLPGELLSRRRGNVRSSGEPQAWSTGPVASCTLASGGKIDAATRLVLETLGIAATEQRRNVLRDLELSARAWTTQVKATENDYYRVIGAADGILAYAEEIGQRWLQGLGVARLMAERRKPPRPA